MSSPQLDAVPRTPAAPGQPRELTLRARFLPAINGPIPRTVTVGLHGELDLLTVDRARRVLIGAVDDAAPDHRRTVGAGGRVVCDLDGLDFLALRGVEMLAEVADHARGLRVDLVVAATGRRTRRVIDLCGFRYLLRPPGAGRPGVAPTGDSEP